jgi:hypothetical protein
VVAAWWAPSVGLFVASLMGAPRRALTEAVAAIMFFAVFLKPPVCDPIPAERVPDFETMVSLEVRAQRGEPFCRIDGRWSQSKSWLARQLFF